MLLPRILAPTRACIKRTSASLLPTTRICDVLRTANGTSSRSPPSHILSFVRQASHQSQGRANGAKQGPGKRLGAKKTGGQFVIPGNIIFRQRGTAWFPGENCAMGRDHCIYSKASGYVRYYRDPVKHPKRQYIGVVFEREDTLPYPQNAPRKRRLGMVAVMAEDGADSLKGQTMVDDLQVGDGTGSDTSIRALPRVKKSSGTVTGKSGYAYRQSNWEIGRAAEKANVQVKMFVPGDRWTAWRRSKARIEANAEKKRLRTAGKKAGKPKKKR